ncbi:MAG: MFS transporter [Gammaproteobacteria bacterium]|jgi:AAA family ATP:ADP antiporter|nr:MFS transporter [Gammaproteobacteria bacterium]MDH3749180.1 MFS transporter [Gammaproteobacteria bacterium]
MSDGSRGNPLTRAVRAATKVEPNELNATLLSFLFIFALMLAYNILKPVRDAMAPDWSDVALARLWTYNFFFSAAAVGVYGFAVSRLRLKYLVPGVYGFFATSFVLFYLGARAVDDVGFIEKAFYLWISLFSLFHISVFWSLMADLFSKTQALRLFAIIASGASVGTIAGSAATLALANVLGTMNLMLIAAVILVSLVPVIGWLYHLKSTQLQPDGDETVGDQNTIVSGNPFAGFTEFIRNPFLLGIAVFIFLYTTIGSFAYFEIKNLLEDLDRDARAQVWAGINLTVNTLTIVTAMFATGRIASRFGLAKTLATVPLIVAVGFLAVAVNPLLAVVIVSWVILKAGNYAITRPGREMLYTLVNREDRFKAKPVIDIVVYRGGDVLASWAFAGLTAALGLGLGAVAAVGAAIALVWAVVGVYLGRSYDRATASAADSIAG